MHKKSSYFDSNRDYKTFCNFVTNEGKKQKKIWDANNFAIFFWNKGVHLLIFSFFEHKSSLFLKVMSYLHARLNRIKIQSVLYKHLSSPIIPSSAQEFLARYLALYRISNIPINPEKGFFKTSIDMMHHVPYNVRNLCAQKISNRVLDDR